MSYEGYTEYLCVQGHHHAYDVYFGEDAACPACGQPWAYRHDVDQTNGSNENEPWTCAAPKVEVGADDVWHTDHHGNRYATRLLRYGPAGAGIWIALTSGGAS